jgi:hypothetical protein
MRFFAWWLAILAIVCGARAAHADARDDSRAAFRRGVTLAQQGDYRHARDAFLEAYKLFAHPSILLNLGIARWKIGEYVEAEEDLAKFLADDGGASQEEIASARAALAAVRAKLGSLRVRVAPKFARATLDGRPIALVPGELAELRATAGDHTFEAQAEGFVPKRLKVTVEAGRGKTVDVALEQDKAASGGQVEPPPGGTTNPPTPPPDTGMSTRHIVGWILVGTGGGAILLGALAGLRAQALAHEYNSEPASLQVQDSKTRSDGIFLRTAADVAFAVGIVTGGVGAYLLLAPEPKRSNGVSAVVGPGFIGVRGSF